MLEEANDILITALDERMRRIAKEVLDEQAARAAQAVAFGRGHEHASLREDLERIKAKEFISTREAHLLLGCSDGHIRNLVEKARKGKASHPIPFLDLDGVTVFPLTKLLEWAERPKRKPRGAC